MNISRRSLALFVGVLAAAALLGLGGCGGGSGGSSGVTTPPPPTQGTISGSAVKGPVSSATVTAYAISNGTMGAALGSAKTDAHGAFTIAVADYSGPMMLRMQGGTYTDEATGSPMNMLSADVLTCVVPTITVTSGSTMSGIQITPLTSMAYAWARNMAGGMTAANITTANAGVGTAYLGMGVDIVMTPPIDPLVAGSANGASVQSKNYGMLLAAMSQEAKDLGMTSSSAMMTAMIEDASDGIMDGMMAGVAIGMTGMGGMMGGGNMMTTAGTTTLATAMATFINNPMVNKSGVTSVAEMQDLMTQLNQLAASGGHL
jgi:hypothetical protein